MKNTCYGFVLAAVLSLCGAAAYGEAPRWETLSGKWQTGTFGIVPEAGEQPCLLVDRSGLWDCEWFNLSVNFRLSAPGSALRCTLKTRMTTIYCGSLPRRVIRLSRRFAGSTVISACGRRLIFPFCSRSGSIIFPSSGLRSSTGRTGGRGRSSLPTTPTERCCSKSESKTICRLSAWALPDSMRRAMR